MAEDRELVARARKGEQGAFDEIVLRYQDGLYRHLLRLCGRPEEAEDLCQEAFVGLYTALRRLYPERPIAPFLYTIATNAWRMSRRHLNRESPLLENMVETAGDPVSEQVLASLEHRRILVAVAALKPEQREAVSLFYDQGLSYREISGITGAPVGTVSARLKRGLDTLRQTLAAGGAGLVIPAGLGELPQYLTSILQGQATAPGSLVPAVAHGIATLTPAGAGVLTLWKGALVMNKAIYVAIGLAVVGGAVVGVPRLMGHQGSATNSPGPVEIAKTTTTNLSSPSPKSGARQDGPPKARVEVAKGQAQYRIVLGPKMSGTPSDSDKIVDAYRAWLENLGPQDAKTLIEKGSISFTYEQVRKSRPEMVKYIISALESYTAFRKRLAVGEPPDSPFAGPQETYTVEKIKTITFYYGDKPGAYTVHYDFKNGRSFFGTVSLPLEQAK